MAGNSFQRRRFAGRTKLGRNLSIRGRLDFDPAGFCAPVALRLISLRGYLPDAIEMEIDVDGDGRGRIARTKAFSRVDRSVALQQAVDSIFWSGRWRGSEIMCAQVHRRGDDGPVRCGSESEGSACLGAGLARSGQARRVYLLAHRGPTCHMRAPGRRPIGAPARPEPLPRLQHGHRAPHRASVICFVSPLQQENHFTDLPGKTPCICQLSPTVPCTASEIPRSA